MQELIPEVIKIPERTKTIESEVEWLIQWLDARFGHLDFWKLNKKWKRIHYEGVAKEILTMQEMEILKHLTTLLETYRKELQGKTLCN